MTSFGRTFLSRYDFLRVVENIGLARLVFDSEISTRQDALSRCFAEVQIRPLAAAHIASDQNSTIIKYDDPIGMRGAQTISVPSQF